MTFEVPWLAQKFKECQLDQSDSPLGTLAPKNQTVSSQGVTGCREGQWGLDGPMCRPRLN